MESNLIVFLLLLAFGTLGHCDQCEVVNVTGTTYQIECVPKSQICTRTKVACCSLEGVSKGGVRLSYEWGRGCGPGVDRNTILENKDFISTEELRYKPHCKFEITSHIKQGIIKFF